MIQPFRLLVPILLFVVPAPLFVPVRQEQTVPRKQEVVVTQIDEPPSTLVEQQLTPQIPKLQQVVAVIPTPKSIVEKKVIPSPAKVSDSSVTIIGYSNEQCVLYFERVSGIHRSLGYAGDIIPQGNTPKVGSGALEKKYGHIMYVVAIEDTGVLVHESNFVKGAIDERFVPYSDVRGYLYN